MRPMQERTKQKRRETCLLIKSPPAAGKSRALVFIARDKAHLGAMTGSYFRGDAEADSKIQDGSISRYRYDPFSATVRKIEVSQ